MHDLPEGWKLGELPLERIYGVYRKRNKSVFRSHIDEEKWVGRLSGTSPEEIHYFPDARTAMIAMDMIYV